MDHCAWNRSPLLVTSLTSAATRQTTQLGQQRNLRDPDRQLLTTKHANKPSASAGMCLGGNSSDNSICLVRWRMEGWESRRGGRRRPRRRAGTR
ncbi:hypothetical protein ATANTOWER_001504 [Ataeniobius toweri]|uniref:Uncharacterized protein n=1 Tax=Ataeniobius toweri TaxID=208326 RepID=A0ABU7CE24_9TELE|nr:hypothetical protein [Ataeniobius toweri]